MPTQVTTGSGAAAPTAIAAMKATASDQVPPGLVESFATSAGAGDHPEPGAGHRQSPKLVSRRCAFDRTNQLYARVGIWPGTSRSCWGGGSIRPGRARGSATNA